MTTYLNIQNLESLTKHSFFANDRFIVEQPKSDPTKSWFTNEINHLAHAEKYYLNVFRSLEDSTSDEAFLKLMEEARKLMKMGDGLKDNYDYFDEILGATLIPLVLTVAAISLICYAAVQFVASSTKETMAEKNSHADESFAAFSLGLGLALSSVVLAFKSVISLITRPVVTVGNYLHYSSLDKKQKRAIDKQPQPMRFMAEGNPVKQAKQYLQDTVKDTVRAAFR